MALTAAVVLLAAPAVRADAESDYKKGYQSFHDNDVVGAMAPLRAAALAGHVKAMVLLAYILDYSEEDADAAKLYLKAAEAGDTEGMLGYGVMLASGEGLKKDVPAGRAWIVKAAELGNAQAVNVLAMAYVNGEYGISESESNSPEAKRWLELSARDDYLPAIDALVVAYRDGGTLGVDKDPAKMAEYQAMASRIRGLDPNQKKRKMPRAVGMPAPKEVGK
jgi:TPR repeat protein